MAIDDAVTCVNEFRSGKLTKTTAATFVGI